MQFSVVLSLLLGSNHYGIAGWYTMKAVEQGLLVSTLCMNGFGVYYNYYNVSVNDIYPRSSTHLKVVFRGVLHPVKLEYRNDDF